MQTAEIAPNVAGIFKVGRSIALSLPLFETRVPAGFPSPGDDYHPIKIDLDKDLIGHPTATFFVRVCDDSMIEENIHSGDILLVDRAEEAVSGDIVVAQNVLPLVLTSHAINRSGARALCFVVRFHRGCGMGNGTTRQQYVV